MPSPVLLVRWVNLVNLVNRVQRANPVRHVNPVHHATKRSHRVAPSARATLHETGSARWIPTHNPARDQRQTMMHSLVQPALISNCKSCSQKPGWDRAVIWKKRS